MGQGSRTTSPAQAGVSKDANFSPIGPLSAIAQGAVDLADEANWTGFAPKARAPFGGEKIQHFPGIIPSHWQLFPK
jgi:hypothetical protein